MGFGYVYCLKLFSWFYCVVRVGRYCLGVLLCGWGLKNCIEGFKSGVGMDGLYWNLYSIFGRGSLYFWDGWG